MYLDMDLLIKKLDGISEKEEIAERKKMLRTLLLVLARDQRTISELTLEDMAELFAESTSIISCYNEKLEYSLDEGRLVDFYKICRRAV